MFVEILDILDQRITSSCKLIYIWLHMNLQQRNCIILFKSYCLILDILKLLDLKILLKYQKTQNTYKYFIYL